MMTRTELVGQIERITFSSPDTGYTVARVRIRGQSDLTTVVGTMPEPAPGEILSMTGRWVNSPKYGLQFQIDTYETRLPATEFGIMKYLGSGLVKGIGPVMAKRIVKVFKEETLEVIENQPERLSEVEGIGKKRIRMIREAWDAQREIRDVMLFLQSHGVSSAYAAKIFKAYGSESIPVVQANPYQLAEDIFGIGFVTADRIAEQLGIPRDSPQRLEAGILYVLFRLADEGHVCYPYEPLVGKVMEILGQERDPVVEALGAAAVAGKIVLEDLNEDLSHFVENNKAVFLAKYRFCEERITFHLKRLARSERSVRSVDADRALVWLQGQLPLTLAPMQETAVRKSLEEKVLVITGGPGTGKTTIINGIIRLYGQIGARILLAAPTGRAAKRMAETTGHAAVTIHRMLEYSLQKSGFQKNEDSPLVCDLLIVDEASMIDTILMHHLLKAVPPESIMILVGDVDQLPSVGAGNVLGDIIASERFCVIRLTTIFRQAEESSIIVNAHRINSGKFPKLKAEAAETDFFFIERQEPEAVVETLVELVKNRIPARFGLHSFKEIQVLTPMHRGLTGAANLNEALQAALNPMARDGFRGTRQFRPGDKVMQIRNNYDKDVFNGDIGRILEIRPIDQEVRVEIDGREVVYDFHELDELVLAYAISVHKSQGSEYPAVVMPVTTQHYLLLQRNLLYTAVTRGKRLVVLVGTKKALAMAVRNSKPSLRHTRLSHRLL